MKKSERIAGMAATNAHWQFKEAHWKNPLGPPHLNTGTFGYLTVYADAKRKAENKGRNISVLSPVSHNCWNGLGENRRCKLGRSGVPDLTD